MATAALGYDDRDSLYGSLREHFLRIGDTQFYVPPTAISVSRRIKSNKSNMLRGRGSFVKGSGYSDQVIQLTLFFPDMISINNELRPLLAQLRKCPFLPIENTLLNDTYKIDAITVAGVTVQTVDGFPHCLEAQLQLYAFNPFTYIVDDTDRTFDEMFNWPLFRWYYQQSLKKNQDPDRNLIFYEPLQMDLHNDYIFRMASEDDLEFIRKWKKSRNRLVMDYMRDKNDDDWDWIGVTPVPKVKNKSISYDKDGLPVWEGTFSNEYDEERFFETIDEMYRDDPKKVISENDIHMENWDVPGLYLQQMSVSYENVITPLQIQAHESPTHQYMGSQDTIFVAQFIAEDSEALGSVEAMVRRSTYLSREYHKELSNGFIQFDHQLCRLFGVSYMVIEDMQSSTIPGQPGVYSITLTMTSYNRAQKRMAETKWLSNDIDWKISFGEKAWWNIADKPWLREDPLGGFMSMDVRKKALYDLKVKEMLKAVEVYPDLELPTYDEVKAAGFEIHNINNGIFVDPDFFLIYGDPIDYGEQMGRFIEEGAIAEARDYMGAKAEVSAGNINPDEETAKSIEAQKEEAKTASAFADPPSSIDEKNMSAADIETIIRKKANENGVDQRFAVALAQAFDTEMRQFYGTTRGSNSLLGKIEVAEPNVPIMMSRDMKYYSDKDYIREASYIGVMRVSPLMGETYGLANNIEYNITQGCVSLKYYMDQVKKSPASDNVKNALGLINSSQTMWAVAAARYLGFEREINALIKDNKKIPSSVGSLLKKISVMAWKLKADKSIDEKYATLPVADYKKVSLNSAEPSFKKKKDLSDADYQDPEITMKEMYSDMVKYDRRGRLIRAFPTFFLTFIDEGQFVGAVKMSDNFFGYRAVTDITYSNSRKLASSTLTMELSNVFGNLSDAIKSNDLTHTSLGDLFQTLMTPGSMANEIERSRNRDPAYYKSMYLRTGARIHFRMGYGSNPMNMPTMMNGVITSLENNGETVIVVCQDDGIELTNKLKAKPDEQSRGFLFSTQEPTEILDELLTDNQGALKNFYANSMSNSAYANHSLGIMHFGMPGKPINYFWRWELSDRPQNEITMNIYETTGLLKEETNGFWHKLGDFFGIGDSDEQGININLYDKTIWDVLNISASVGEDYITAVHPFDFRNTIFLGKPHFPIGYGYSPRDLGESLKNNAFGIQLSDNDSDFSAFAIDRKPFRQIHMYDSWSSIINNGIIATDENMYTVAQGVYYDEGRMDTTDFIYVDTNIWPEKQRSVQIDTQLNLQGVRLIENIPLIGHTLNKPFKWYFDEYTAIRIAAAGLRDLVKEMYDGYLTVVGDPTAKPHNMVYLYDTHMDMSGPVEMREVTHIMNFDVGYITMIKPDACVVNSDKKAMSFWASAGALAARMFVYSMVRNKLKNSKYAGSMPIMNALWASVKRRYNVMQGKFDNSKLKNKIGSWFTKDGKVQRYTGSGGPIYEVDPVTGKTREYAPVSAETKKRWNKSGILKDLASKIEGFTYKDANNLFDKLDANLANNRFLRYDKIDLNKIEKLKDVSSAAMFKSTKALGKISKWGRKGIQGVLGAGALLAGPPGWIAFAIEFAITEIVTAGISEWIERFLFTRKACVIATLRKDGVEFSAGINGHHGSVIGDSPDIWQKTLTGPIGSLVLGFLGADTAKYGVTDASNLEGIYAPQSLAQAEQSPAPQLIDMNLFATNFFQAHRKQVFYDEKLVQQYEQDKKDTAEIMTGHLKEKELEQQRKPSYKAEESSLLTSDSLQSMFGTSGESGVDPTSFQTIDLNKPSGISAEAINKMFAGKGKLAGTGEYFVMLEKGIPTSPSPLGIIIEQPGETGHVMNALYLAAHAAWETGWGDSDIFKDKNNLFGYGAYDHSPYDSAYSFASVKDCIFYAANKIKDNYLTKGGKYYNGPTLKGMNVKYASDKNWAKGIAGVMAMIAKKDPNFVSPESVSKAQTTGEVPSVVGSTGKKKYHLSSESEAAKACVNIKKQPLTNMKLTMVTSSPYIRKASYDLLEALGKAYKQKTGQTICITSAFRQGDPNWHGTGYGVDVDTPNCGYIGGKCRFPKGSKDKENLTILMELAAQVGFSGIIHGDVDVVADLKAKYPSTVFQQRNDHFNHLHLSYPK